MCSLFFKAQIVLFCLIDMRMEVNLEEEEFIHGSGSTEAAKQAAREKAVFPAVYLHKDQIPKHPHLLDAPAEPYDESKVKCIPFEVRLIFLYCCHNHDHVSHLYRLLPSQPNMNRQQLHRKLQLQPRSWRMPYKKNQI